MLRNVHWMYWMHWMLLYQFLMLQLIPRLHIIIHVSASATIGLSRKVIVYCSSHWSVGNLFTICLILLLILLFINHRIVLLLILARSLHNMNAFLVFLTDSLNKGMAISVLHGIK